MGTKKRSLEQAQKELAAAQDRVVRLETEQTGIGAAVATLDPLNEAAFVQAHNEMEARREALPHLIRHAKKAEAEAEIPLLDLQMEEAEAQKGPLSERIEALQEEFTETQRRLDAARAEYQELALGHLSDLRRAKRAAERRLAALNREPHPEERGPVVRSLWQRLQGVPGSEDFLQETPPAFRPGSANVSDKPLSAGDGSAQGPAVVVPTKAIEEHQKAKK